MIIANTLPILGVDTFLLISDDLTFNMSRYLSLLLKVHIFLA